MIIKFFKVAFVVEQNSRGDIKRDKKQKNWQGKLHLFFREITMINKSKNPFCIDNRPQYEATLIVPFFFYNSENLVCIGALSFLKGLFSPSHSF